jgi:hypothetical protein
MDAPRRLTVGDRVRVHGGYDGDRSDWLRGGEGYRGTIRKLTAEAAAVELDVALVLDAPPGTQWQDFGRGSMSALRETGVAGSEGASALLLLRESTSRPRGDYTSRSSRASTS